MNEHGVFFSEPEMPPESALSCVSLSYRTYASAFEPVSVPLQVTRFESYQHVYQFRLVDRVLRELFVERFVKAKGERARIGK